MQRLNEVIDELKELYPNYEERKEQREMWEATYRSMRDGEKIAIHAPTGTGKSLGYVIPAIAMKLDDQRFKMTISTFTLNLQDQLAKDMELGIKIYNNILRKKGMKGKRLTYVALKGQKNYFCKKRALEIAPGELSTKKIDEILDASETSKIWDRQNMNLNVSYKEWEHVQVEGCVKRQCPFHSNCTYFKSFNDINQYDFVITNHSLWFTRFYYVEPWEEFNYFVFDEAHKLEKVLLETYTFDISARKLENWVEQGVKLAVKFGTDEGDAEDWSHSVFHDHHVVEASIRQLESIGNRCYDQSSTLDKLKIHDFDARSFVLDLSKWQQQMFQTFKEQLISPEVADDESFKEEMKGWVKNLLDLKEFAMLAAHPQNVATLWVEKDAKDQITLKVTPKSISLISTPFVKGTLVTSGTLAENRSCSSFAKRMKMDLDTDLVLNSPFPLQEQTMVYVSKEISPKKPNYEELLEDEIFELLKAGKQKTFVLFTSNKLMWAMFKKLHVKLREMDTYNYQPLELWIQDKNNHKQVVESFKDKEKRSILFGTLSYFEGIDLKGDSLTQIILTRLPYSVPTHPIQEILDANYGYSQWEAIVRYEQAFGRLIRTGYDYGAFCILDNRISYLKQFADMFVAEHIPIVTEIEEIEEFYRRQK